MADHNLIDQVLARLGTPLHRRDLVTAVGLDPGSDDAWTVLHGRLEDPRLVELDDGRIASGAALLRGVVLWHRVDPVEATIRQVALGLDAILGATVAPDPFSVQIGDHLCPVVAWNGRGEPDLDRIHAVDLPDGWSPGLAAGDLVALVLDGDRLRLRHAEDAALPSGPPAGESEAAALGCALADMASAAAGGGPSRLRHLADPQRPLTDQWVLDLVASGPRLLADHGDVVRALQRSPLREASVRAGLAVQGPAVAGPAVHPQQLATYLVGRIVVGEERADMATTEACGIVLGALCGPEPEGFDERATVEVVHRLLTDPLTAELLVDHLRLVNQNVVSDAERRLRPVRAAHPRAPGPAWVQAALLLRQARPHDARQVLERMVARTSIDGWPAVARTTARLRAIAGDVAGAAALLRRVGEGVEAEHLTLGWCPPPKVGRNERCPCGSGAKAKVCCGQRPVGVPLAGRVDRLWEALMSWALSEQSMPLQAVSSLVGRLPLDDGAAFATTASALDVVLLDGDGLGGVLDEVGSLLPPDEYDLAARWRTHHHGLWSIERGPGPDDRVWREVCTGVRANVVGRLGATTRFVPPPVGAHVLAALLVGPAGHHIAGSPIDVSVADIAVVRAVVSGPRDLGALVEVIGQLAGDGPAPPGSTWTEDVA